MRQRRHQRKKVHQSTALQRLAELLETKDEAAWYAARIDRLGRAVFGDLWKPAECEATKEQPPPS